MPLSNYKPEYYSTLLQDKTERLTALLKPFDAPALTVYESPTSGFRMRAEFRFWHTENDANYVMFPKGQPDKPFIIKEFPIAHPKINELMQNLRKLILKSEILKNKLFQIEFLTTLSGDSLITMIYHKALDEQWQQEAQDLESKLATSIIGRSRKQKLVLSKDYVDETLKVSNTDYHYRQIEGSFTQPNAYINQHMLTWAQAQLNNVSGDFLELYCGNGNFTVALANQFNQVLATEISKPSVRAAHHNFSTNHIDNVKVCRMSSEEITTALNGDREFRRLKQQEIKLDQYQFSTVLVDPPRAGLDDATLQLIQGFDHILYISCNPETLTDNLKTLCKTHSIESSALFDQFPYTDHIETGIFLSRKCA